MWKVSGIPKEHQKGYNKISRKRDWSWVAPNNKAFGHAVGRGLIVIDGVACPFKRPYITEKVATERIKHTLIWISLVVEKLGIQEEVPRGIFEGIYSYV